ncbi:L-threonine 3-dehydrogenase [Limnochorda pilosa]|uniref:L-threonine 3-dehydrogenase n=1 Tax=Limnochorda pilosa TaxID=1555112 RepID=A0A0K2SGS8_LIMPI|nr:L-threonine 3-dehydrogenase [Limnochorda pilosa]BAS26044.1 L-threonine 3-dehydrogenase [Limnochorda pilosa]
MDTRMLALEKARPEPGARLVERPVPEPGPGQVLVQVTTASICGTDVHIYEWNEWARARLTVPRVFGHEFCGRLVSVGPGVNPAEFQPGTYVTAEMHMACGRCYYCRTGQSHICQDVRIGGIDADGSFAQYVAVPAANVWKLDPSIPEEVASILDPLGNAVHTALSVPLTGRHVLVTGCGPIGLISVAIARMAGAASITATDVSAYRRELASRLGARALDPREGVLPRMLEQTDGLGADVVLEMSGHPTAIRDGLSSLKKGGEMVLLGLPGEPVALDLGEGIIFKEITLRGINGRRIFQTWYQVQALLQAGLDIRPVITHRFPLERYQEAFELAASGQCGKIILVPPQP